MAEIILEGVTKRFPDGSLAVKDVDLEIADGEFVILVGPSGCGKSTTLNMIAGLEDITEGTLRIGDRVVNDLAPKERDVAMVFQSYALYPHLSVHGNLSLGLRIRGMPLREREQRIAAVLELLQLTDLQQRRPAQLSGGQRQRVALARALLRQPRLVLLDEPMSNLDAQLREELRPELRRLLCGGEPPVIYVTHDQQEAMGMADRIALLRDGRLQQLGTARELYEQPANRFVAGFLGRPAINLLAPEGARQLGVRPVHLRPVAEGGLPARVRRREWWGAQQLLWLDTPRGELRMLLSAQEPVGAELEVGWNAADALWFHAASGERLGSGAASG